MKDQHHALTPVPFKGDTIYSVEHEGELFTPLRPIIENMGLSWPTQSVKLNGGRERWSVANIETVAEDGKTRSMLCVPVRKLAGFLATINWKKVRNDLRRKVLTYQRECDDALWKYWNEGRAVNPRSALPDFTNPAEAARAWALQFEERERLALTLQENQPKVEYADSIIDSSGSIRIGDFAKLLNNGGIPIGRNRLFQWLRDMGYLMSCNIPYQRHIEDGYFVVRETTRPSSSGPIPCLTTRITGKGQLHISQKIRNTMKGVRSC